MNGVTALVAGVLLATLAMTPGAHAQTYSDVPSGYWARGSIDWITDRGPVGNKVLDDYADTFKPDRAITRRQMARALVVASGHWDDRVTDPVALPDMEPGDAYYRDVQLALQLRLMAATKDGFLPLKAMTASKAEAAVVRMVKLKYPGYDWGLLTKLKPQYWRPNPGWNTKAPPRLPYIVASRALLLRFNHPYPGGEKRERSPGEPMPRAEVAYMLRQALTLASWEVAALSSFEDITFPTLSARQRQITSFALRYVGHPYVFAGEYPTEDSPYGYQAHGGFDCSGFVWWVMKITFKYPIGIDERGASDMARRAKPRIGRRSLKCGDVIFFGSNGTSSSVSSIYHAAIYLGRGWFIHSTGSADGVTLASLNTSSYWRQHFAWGRRLLTRAQLSTP